MDKKEFLSKVKVEFRAFQSLLEKYGDPIEAYEAWKGESWFDVSSVLERLVFYEMKSVDDIKKELDIYCKLIDEDLWWLEHNLDFDEYIDRLMINSIE